MKAEQTASIRVSHRFNAPAERVFDAWLDPKTVGRWLFATSDGEIVRADIDAKVGGRFVITDRRDGEDVEHTGEYLEIARPHRLVFTFGVPKYSDVFSRVTVEITPLETGCELVLTNEGLLPEYESRTAEGWTMILASLERTLA